MEDLPDIPYEQSERVIQALADLAPEEARDFPLDQCVAELRATFSEAQHAALKKDLPSVWSGAPTGGIALKALGQDQRALVRRLAWSEPFGAAAFQLRQYAELVRDIREQDAPFGWFDLSGRRLYGFELARPDGYAPLQYPLDPGARFVPGGGVSFSSRLPAPSGEQVGAAPPVQTAPEASAVPWERVAAALPAAVVSYLVAGASLLRHAALLCIRALLRVDDSPPGVTSPLRYSQLPESAQQALGLVCLAQSIGLARPLLAPLPSYLRYLDAAVLHAATVLRDDRRWYVFTLSTPTAIPGQYADFSHWMPLPEITARRLVTPA